MHKRFDSSEIEQKWQKKWSTDKLYEVGERDSSKEKEYVLVELPYPSGNLHIGHWYAFAVPDIYVRFRRMQGKQMLFPMGFDAFGLPAENAAIKRKLDPKAWTNDNIAYMKEQLGSMGSSFSWDKTASTTDPEYYKWTQWMFTQFFEKGIAYRGTGTVNWCPGCNTVIANEQVLSDGTCERSGDVIEKKSMPQWMLRITDYADRLLEDLDELDWPEHIKEAQRQWIGRSQGARLHFVLNTGDSVDVFTTRPDTLFGATYMVLAPEHTLVKTLRTNITNWTEVETYIAETSKKDEQDRLNDTKEKTGVLLHGITAINPATKEEIPVFIADYVLASYGTGAIMAVPAHDERDNEFAKKFNLATRPIVEPKPEEVRLYTDFVTSDNHKTEIDLANEFLTSLHNNELVFTGNGKLINSGKFDGMDSEEAKVAITQEVGGEMTNTYRLRDWSVGRQRYWGVPIPIVYDPDGKAHVVPTEHLPWVLPEDVDPTPTGVAPLAKSEELKRRTEEIFGKGWIPEVETMDTFVDSSWYFLRYLDNQNDDELCALDIQKEWMPIDVYFGGAEHTTMHLLYSRFWQKALYDLGLVAHNEPYARRINRGLILGPDGNKMSKSKGNVIDPDEQVKLVGADAVKMYLAFMGPYEGSNYPWDNGGIAGQRRFLERVYGLDEHICTTEPDATTKLLHKTIQKVSSDIPEYKFNTAISALMVFLNTAEKEGLSNEAYLIFLRLVAPFAPHLSEELWEMAGQEYSIHSQSWPVADETLAADEEVTIGVQVNGKMRGSITVPADANEATALLTAGNNETIAKYLNGTPDRVIYVPGRILNIICT